MLEWLLRKLDREYAKECRRREDYGVWIGAFRRINKSNRENGCFICGEPATRPLKHIQLGFPFKIEEWTCEAHYAQAASEEPHKCPKLTRISTKELTEEHPDAPIIELEDGHRVAKIGRDYGLVQDK